MKYKNLETFIADYVQHFGSLTKNDFEMLIMGYVIESNFFQLPTPITNYSLSIKLGISESKVKRLRHEYALRYGNLGEQELREQTKACFLNGNMNGNATQIILQVEDMMLRQYIIHLFKAKGKICDKSNSDEILVVYTKDIDVLLDDIYKGEKEYEEFKNKINVLSQNGKTKESIWKDILVGAVAGFANGFGQTISTIFSPTNLLQIITTL